MALQITKPQPPQLLGISADVVAKISELGGKLDLPDVDIYLRLGAVLFPRPRSMVMLWEVWPSKDAARERSANPETYQLQIGPVPTVIRPEIQDSDGNVISPALVMPTYDEFMSTPLDTPAERLSDVFDQAKSLAYKWAKTWPEFAGAIDV